MARPQQRYHGVRQRHWGSWVSEIRHPLLKTRIWLGTFESGEDAARAYDEAARIMCGPRTRTNFPNDAPSSSSFLSPALVAKLHCFNVASGSQAAQQQREKDASSMAMSAEPRVPAPGPYAGMGNAGAPSSAAAAAGWNGGFLEEQYVEQMIEELLDSNFYMEISY